jgi:hypothetical protein
VKRGERVVMEKKLELISCIISINEYPSQIPQIPHPVHAAIN